MSISVELKPIPVRKRYNTKGLQQAVQSLLEATGAKAKTDLTKVTASWKHKVNFKVEVRVRFGDAAVRVITDDEVFHYLNEGTSVRYALMSSDWISKTAPGRKTSRAGRGSVVYIGKRSPWKRSRKRWPRPGIKARGWVADAQKGQVKPLQVGVIRIMNGKLLI